MLFSFLANRLLAITKNISVVCGDTQLKKKKTFWYFGAVKKRPEWDLTWTKDWSLTSSTLFRCSAKKTEQQFNSVQWIQSNERAINDKTLPTLALEPSSLKQLSRFSYLILCLLLHCLSQETLGSRGQVHYHWTKQLAVCKLDWLYII